MIGVFQQYSLSLILRKTRINQRSLSLIIYNTYFIYGYYFMIIHYILISLVDERWPLLSFVIGTLHVKIFGKNWYSYKFVYIFVCLFVLFRDTWVMKIHMRIEFLNFDVTRIHGNLSNKMTEYWWKILSINKFSQNDKILNLFKPHVKSFTLKKVSS